MILAWSIHFYSLDCSHLFFLKKGNQSTTGPLPSPQVLLFLNGHYIPFFVSTSNSPLIIKRNYLTAFHIMRGKAFVLSVLLLIVLLGQITSASLTEADFKKMKVKDLRRFLQDRGLSCDDCQEKGDLVKMAFANQDKPAGPSATKDREVPQTTFWDAWSEEVKKQCEELTTKRDQDPTAEPYASVCSAVSMATESFLMQHGKRVAAKLKKTPANLLKTSYKHVYYDAGMVIFRRLIDKCLASPAMRSKCESLGFVTDTMENKDVADFIGWVTNVGIENTNPMYEILEEGGDL